MLNTATLEKNTSAADQLNANRIDDNSCDLSELILSAKNLPYTYSQTAPKCKAKLRSKNSNFQVEEILSFQTSGEGEHLFLNILKDGNNTEWVIRQLMKKSGLAKKNIGYAGKKDRHSLSLQWFSLHLPGKAEDIDTPSFIQSLNGEGYRIINNTRHNKKLRVGSVLRNNFKITLTEVSGEIDNEVFKQLRDNGFANYFGYQRFGRDFNNLKLAHELLVNKIKIKNSNKRGLVISSARSFLFNKQLEKRILENNWDQAVEGDCFMLNQSRSYFSNTELDNKNRESIADRLKSRDIHVSGWLAGYQTSETSRTANELELRSMSQHTGWLKGLSELKINSDRRAFRAVATDLKCEKENDELIISFGLSSGSYATALLREIVDFDDVSLVTV